MQKKKKKSQSDNPIERLLYPPRRSCFFYGQKEENEFPGPGDPFEQRFLIATKSNLFAGKKAQNVIALQGDHLRNLCLDFKHVTFLACQKTGNEFAGPVYHLNIASVTCSKSHLGPARRQKIRRKGRSPLDNLILDLSQVAFWAGHWTENEFLRPGEPLKFCFLDLAQVAIWDHQNAENVFVGPSDHLIHRYLDLSKVVFSAG
jgi:hypothetical protein